jgi:hypothetical protein
MARADEIQEVRPGLYYWQAYEPAVKVDLSCCALRTAQGLVFLDPIPLAKPALEELLSAGPPLAIVLTSGNHGRAAAEFRRRLSIPIHAHADAVGELDFPVDHLVADGDILVNEITVVRLSGGAPGEIALHSPQSCHVGDALIHLPPLGFALLPDKYCQDAAELRRSVEKLLRIPFEVLTFAHGLPIVSHARQRLSQLLA